MFRCYYFPFYYGWFITGGSCIAGRDGPEVVDGGDDTIGAGLSAAFTGGLNGPA